MQEETHSKSNCENYQQQTFRTEAVQLLQAIKKINSD